MASPQFLIHEKIYFIQHTDKDFVLYAQMQKTSKVLGKFSSGVAATAVKSFTVVNKAGKSTVATVKDTSLGLKMGDEVDMVFNMGEGFFKAQFKNKWIEFSDDKITLKEIEAPQYESWLEMKVGKLEGYSPTFPFLGCLE